VGGLGQATGGQAGGANSWYGTSHYGSYVRSGSYGVPGACIRACHAKLTRNLARTPSHAACCLARWYEIPSQSVRLLMLKSCDSARSFCRTLFAQGLVPCCGASAVLQWLYQRVGVYAVMSTHVPFQRVPSCIRNRIVASPTVAAAALGLVVFGFGVATGLQWGPLGRGLFGVAMGSRPTAGALVAEAWDGIDRLFYPSAELNPESMVYGAIEGMVASLKDPYTSFVPPDQGTLETDALEGEFGGIGVSLLPHEGDITIAEVTSGSPAEAAGIRVGDVLQAVDGINVRASTLYEAVVLVRGEVGTVVELEMRRGDTVLFHRLVRWKVELPSISWQMLPGDFGYIHIQVFTGRTADEVARALEELGRSSATALVLDLRGNGGGAVDGALGVLGQLIGHGIGFRELRKGASEQRHPIPFRAEPIDLPMAVLVDGGTGSAAELVAAAIQDHGRGALVGARTFGKGSMQGIFPLRDGSSLHLTISRWLSADGHSVEGVGIAPDIVASAMQGDPDGDTTLARALEYLKAALPTGSAHRPRALSYLDRM
jgi:carboxyl-terminal processing protease